MICLHPQRNPQLPSLTFDRHELNLHVPIILNDQIILPNKIPAILGITYDLHATFTPCITIIIKAIEKSNTHTTLLGTILRQGK